MLTNLVQELTKAFDHLHNEFNKLQVWRANPSLVEWIHINAYWQVQPLKNLASVSVLDSQTLSIQPWDKNLLRDIDKWITDAWIWLNPQNNWDVILIKIPPLTEERRRDLVKIAKKLSEECKISIRNIRQDYHKKIDSAESSKEITEDISRDYNDELQKNIKSEIEKIDNMLKHKEDEIMKV